MELSKRKNVKSDEAEEASTSSAPQNENTSREEKIYHKKSLLNLLGQSRVSEATLQVWRQLPGEIRHDPSMINFQREAERWKGKNSNIT